MNIKKISYVLIALVGTLAARAGLITINNEALFQSQGAITHNSNFNDFGTAFNVPGDPFTRGDVTYLSGFNFTWGSATIFTSTQTLIGYGNYAPITNTIANSPQYNMLGFEIGSSYISSYLGATTTITVTTNLGTYTFANLNIADSNQGQLDFKGFIADPGEYFTGFQVINDGGVHSLPGLTNVQVGHSTSNSVPDDASVIALVGMTFLGLVWARRRMRA